jgi:DNA-binding NarL/FixJ family response regulator
MEEQKVGELSAATALRQPRESAGASAPITPGYGQAETPFVDVLVLEAHDPLSRFIESFSRLYRLSPHQSAVLGFAARGLCRKESAQRMACSLKTVDEHWRRVYAKSACTSEPEVMSKLLIFALTHRADR